MEPSASARWMRIIGLTVTATVALAACGQGDSDRDKNLTYEDSPLSQWHAKVLGYEEMKEEEFQKQQKETEEAIAQCMQAEGFEYTPVEQKGIFNDGSDDGEEPEYGSKEFVEKYGYQAFTGFQIGNPEEGEGEEFVDPNQERIEAMSPSEQEAYDIALYGDQSAIDYEDPEFDPNSLTPEQQGCSGQAYAESNKSSEIEQSEEMQLFTEEVSEFYENLEKNLDLDKINAQWVACMKDKGYADRGWKTPQEAASYYQEKSMEMFNESGGGAIMNEEMDPSAGDADSSSADDPGAMEDPTQSPEWKKMAEEEISTAKDDFSCQEKIHWQQESLKKTFEAEQKFMDEHQDLMNQIAAKAEESQK